MKKKLFTIAISLIMVLTLCQSAFAKGPCPINYSCFITHDEQGTPSIHFSFVNTTISTINYIEYKASLFTREWQNAFDTTNTSSSCRIKISNLKLAGNYASEDVVTLLSSYPAAAHVGKIQYLKVMFDDGSTWESNSYFEPKAEIACLNKVQNNKYIPHGNTITLCDSSINSECRQWYAWNDSLMDWVWFSDALKPEYTFIGTQACIKLVINSNDNFYAIRTFDIYPVGIGVTCYNTDKTCYSFEEPLSFNMQDSEAPYKIALWDFTDLYTSRAWYIWDDISMSWQYLSPEQGPSIDMWEIHDVCLKIVYDNNSENYMIYNIYIK